MPLRRAWPGGNLYPEDGKTRPNKETHDIWAMIKKDRVEPYNAGSADIEQTLLFASEDDRNAAGPDYEIPDLIGPLGAHVAPIRVDSNVGNATGSTYGNLEGLTNGTNKVYKVSLGSYERGTIRVWQDTLELVEGTGFTETSPALGTVTWTLAPPANTKLIVLYNPTSLSGKLSISQSAATNSIYPDIIGTPDGVRTVFTIATPFTTGTLILSLNGSTMYQGTDQDWQEGVSASPITTITMSIPPLTGQILQVWYAESAAGWMIENTDTTLSGVVNGSNTTFTTTYPYVMDSLRVIVSTLANMSGADFTPTIPADGTFDTVVAPASPAVVQAVYKIANFNTLGTPHIPLLKTGAYTIVRFLEYIQCDATGGAFTVKLPLSLGHIGWEVGIIKLDATANTITVDGNGTNINGVATQTISIQFDSPRYILGLNTSGNAEWHSG